MARLPKRLSNPGGHGHSNTNRNKSSITLTMRKSKIPTIIGIFILVFGLAAGVLLVRNQNFFRLGASAEFAPKDVRISNITDSSATVSWITDRETSGFVKWGEGQDSLDKTELDELTSQSFTPP